MFIQVTTNRQTRRSACVERLSRRDVVNQWRSDIVPFAVLTGVDLDTSWYEYIAGLVSAGAVGRSAEEWFVPRVDLRSCDAGVRL